MAEAVGRDRELDGDVGLVVPGVELAAVGQHVVDHRLAAGPGQELVDHDPLVMPAHQPLRLGEDLAGIGQADLGLHIVDGGVVELEEGELQLRDDQVLVVAGIADDRAVLAVARHVELAGRPALLDQKGYAAAGLVVEMRAAAGPGAVDVVEREARGAEVRDLLRVDLPLEAGGRVEGHVVVEELPEEGEPGRQVRIVRVLRRQRRVGDQVGRRLGQVVLGVHDAAGLADLDERRAGLRRVGGEGGQVAEHPAEAAGVVVFGLRRNDVMRIHAVTGHDNGPPSVGCDMLMLRVQRQLGVMRRFRSPRIASAARIVALVFSPAPAGGGVRSRDRSPSRARPPPRVTAPRSRRCGARSAPPCRPPARAGRR